MSDKNIRNKKDDFYQFVIYYAPVTSNFHKQPPC